MEKHEFIWNYLVELRKEVVERQKIRIQIIYFKFTFISAFGLLISNSLFSRSGTSQALIEIPKSILITIPALAAVFFDYILNAYNFSILRIGEYIKNHLETEIKSMLNLEEVKLWEEFLENPTLANPYARVGNSGITIMTIVIAIIALIVDFHLYFSLPLIILLCFCLFFDIKAFKEPQTRIERFRATLNC